MQIPLLSFTLSCFLCTSLNAQKKEMVQDSVHQLDEVIIKANTLLGNKLVAKNRTGASYFLSNEELKSFSYIDINRALKAVPGVNFYEEDGFGLRPNISLRGTSPQRSSKITLMEDGVLIAPAPYSSPAAYYFPSVLRMEAIEILKGSSQVQYGPFTTGGVINMLSTSIPEESLKANFQTSYGSFNSSQIHSSIGQSSRYLSYLFEYVSLNSDGFKQLSSGENTGFDLTDVMAKVRLKSDETSTTPQFLEFKYHVYDELSNETYLGISEADFKQNPFDRYTASQEDAMDARQIQLMLTHSVRFKERFKMVTNLYNNTFSRNWYKLNGVKVDGSSLGLETVLDSPTSYPSHFAVLKGTIDSEEDALAIKANNRNYTSRGVQTKLNYHWYGKSGTFHDLELGARYHYDEEDRFQWEDGYRIQNADLLLTSQGEKGAKGNRISSASAFAAYALYKFKYQGLTLTPGLRLESINLQREDFGKSNPNRLPSALSFRENEITTLIPGIGFNYTFSNQLSFFGGLHKGFSPPGNAPGELPEQSVNYELGSRFSKGKLSGEFIGYFNDYSNLLGSDLAASGGTGSLDQFNAGRVHVSGLELLLNYKLTAEDAAIQLPLTFAYTLTHAIFQSSFGSAEAIWGEVKTGDRVPYIPQNQWTATARIVHRNFEINLSARYSGAFVTQASNMPTAIAEQVPSNFILDLSAKYHLSKQLHITTQIVNVLNETYLVSRVPAGYRPGHPFGIYTGLQFDL